MCDGHNPDDSERLDPERGWASNLRESGLPWRRVLAIGLFSYVLRMRHVSWCCGKPGSPGC